MLKAKAQVERDLNDTMIGNHIAVESEEVAKIIFSPGEQSSEPNARGSEIIIGVLLFFKALRGPSG